VFAGRGTVIRSCSVFYIGLGMDFVLTYPTRPVGSGTITQWITH
jgi:hypothetical protein